MATASGSQGRSLGATLASNRLLLITTFATAVVVGVIAALALKTWWALAFPLLLHGVATTVVVGLALRMASDADKPDPVKQAALEEEGVRSEPADR